MTPEGWRHSTLGEIAAVLEGGTPKREVVRYWDGNIPWATPSDITALGGRHISRTTSYISEEGLASSSTRLLPTGTVLMTSRATIGACAISDTAMATNQGFQSLVPAESVLSPFLFYLVQSLQAELVRRAAGSTFLEISNRAVRGVEVAVPPLPEQRKIAAILSSVDDVIEKTEAVIEQLQVVKKAMMQELLARGLPGRHTRFKKTEIGVIPEAWKMSTYGELAADLPRAIQSGPFGSTLRHSEFVDGGKLVIGIDNVLDGQFSIGSNHRIGRDKFEELRRFQARPRDLLITVMATVGRCCVVPADIEDAIITKHVYRLSVDQLLANPYFLMYCVYGIPAVSEAVHGHAQGLSRPGLNKSLLLPLPFPLPPLSEQDGIVEHLQAIDHRASRERRTLAELSRTKSALMSVLLTGQLRVTPDSDA